MSSLQERIEAALSRVRDPGSGRDVLTAEKVRDIATSTAGRVRLTLLLAASSGKGGVGKTTVATNLAVALAAQGARVGLMDADIYGPNVPRMMGVDEPPCHRREDHSARGAWREGDQPRLPHRERAASHL